MEIVDIAVPDTTAEGYLVRGPGGEGPGVLLFMDVFGLRPQIAAMCERIASWGYVVLAPNLFYREGRAEELAPAGDLREQGAREAAYAVAGPRIGRLTTDLARTDIAAYLDALRATEGVSPGPLGVTGYCMGARLALRAATDHADEVAAMGGFHSPALATDAADSPHLGLPLARAELVLGHADQDASNPPEAIALLGQALATAGLTASNEVYPDAPHGFTMADTSSYQEAGAERHYAELEALFARRLG